MRFLLIVSLNVLNLFTAKGQQVTSPALPTKVRITAVHPKGTWLVGAGATFFGLTAKGGNFLTERLWLGAELEVHDLFSARREAGVLTRYYLGKGRLRAFGGAGVSYGSFKNAWPDFDNPTPSVKYYSYKLNASTGLELQLTKRFSLEGVLKVGQLTKIDWTLPSVQGSLNIALGK